MSEKKLGSIIKFAAELVSFGALTWLFISATTNLCVLETIACVFAGSVSLTVLFNSNRLYRYYSQRNSSEREKCDKPGEGDNSDGNAEELQKIFSALQTVNSRVEEMQKSLNALSELPTKIDKKSEEVLTKLSEIASLSRNDFHEEPHEENLVRKQPSRQAAAADFNFGSNFILFSSYLTY